MAYKIFLQAMTNVLELLIVLSYGATIFKRKRSIAFRIFVPLALYAVL